MGDLALGRFNHPIGHLILGDITLGDFVLGDYILGDLVLDPKLKYFVYSKFLNTKNTPRFNLERFPIGKKSRLTR